jgi:hypothetical protein
MSKPIECITELNEEEARVFLKVFENPKPNPVRDKIVAQAMAKRKIFEAVK